MLENRIRDAILQVRDDARRRGINAFFTLHREKSHLLRMGNNSVSLNTSEDLTRLDVEVRDGRREGGYTLMGDITGSGMVRAALDKAVAQTTVAVPKDYDPIQPAVEEEIREQPQYDPELATLDPAAKVRAYARIMRETGPEFNYSGSWSSGSTELFLAGTATQATAWHLGTDQHFTCVLKHPREKWELLSDQTGWRTGEVGVEAAVHSFRALLPVYREDGFRVAPGAYSVAFGPQAIGELLALAMWTGFMGRGYEEKLGWTSGNALGDKILSQRVTLVDDPDDGATFRYGFDGAGKRRLRFPLVTNGALTGLAYDLATAARYGRPPTAHAGSWGLVMSPGDGPADLLEALRPLGRVLYIPALHYMNIPNRSKGIFTASSRFNAVLVEDGRVTRPLFSTRITDTFTNVFGNVELLSCEPVAVNLSDTYSRRMPEGASVPAYMVSSGVSVTDCAESF